MTADGHGYRVEREFVDLATKPSGLSTRLRLGTVVAFDPSTFTATVAIGGDATAVTGVAVLRDAYFPVVGDSVWLAQTSTDVLLLGGHGTDVSAERRLHAPTTSTATTTTTAGAEIFDSNLYTQIPVVQGMLYRIVVDGRCDVSGVAPTTFAIRIRVSAISASPSNPTTSSTQVGGTTGFSSLVGGGGEVPCHGVGYFTAGSTGNLIYGISVVRLAGTGEVLLRPPESSSTPITAVAHLLGVP